MKQFGLPPKQGLYDPSLEHDACGIGFVADLRRGPSHDIIEQGVAVLSCLTHRGAAGSDPRTGDGAGILIQTPDKFLRKAADEAGFGLPSLGDYGAGLVFLSTDDDERRAQVEIIEQTIEAEGQALLGWRDVPVDPTQPGDTARAAMPIIRQIFIQAKGMPDQDAFERKLYVIRRVIEKAVHARGSIVHFPSLSSRTLIYKGMLFAGQVFGFFSDLADPDMESRLALVHQRYSTNTFPTWELAQPFRYLAHNGEINTLRGNANWMRAREGTLRSNLFGDDLRKLFPVCAELPSDSAQFDNALEFMSLAGRGAVHGMLMMIPEAWENQADMDPDRRAFYEYHSCLLEPWDGPASMTFSDGRGIGAVLDRNGLRPSRYIVTKDGLVVMGSEVGTLDIKPEDVERKGRLEPGRTFYLDLDEGRIIDDEEIKDQYIQRQPYRTWVETHRVTLDDLPAAEPTHLPDPETRFQRQQAFGYTLEDLRFVIGPMADAGMDPLGSMGDDTALACLSDRSRLLYHYFKQTFAQVTNPAVDSINERPVMSLQSTVGEERNLLDETEDHAKLLRLESPVLRDEELERIRRIDHEDLSSATLDMLYKVADGGDGLVAALDDLCRGASEAIEKGANILILSDRGVGPDLAPIPALLATGAVHHHLIAEGSRTRCGLVIETGEAREVSHMVLLVGYGAAAVNPYLAFETIRELKDQSAFISESVSLEKAISNYVKSFEKGMLKVFAKMGISTLQSYRGAQIFEAVGLAPEVIDRAFARTHSRVKGVGFDVLAREAQMRHERGFPGDEYAYDELDAGGLWQWRRRGERRTFNPSSVAKLQHAVTQKSFDTYKQYAAAANMEAENACTLRGLMRFKPGNPVPLEEVESVSEILKRFCTGAMSYGSISKEAHETLAIAMNRIGGRSNTGEGGEEVERFTPDANGDSRRSAIKQVASGRFGVTSYYLVNSDEMQIKVAQGAKPGEGGQIKGDKVDEVIAKTRYSTPGVGLISPPPHHDIYSIEDLAQLIHDLKNANRRANVSVKLVAETGVGTIAAGVSKGKSDLVLISGHDGGTGNSPMTSIKSAGVPWEMGLSETQQTLVLNDLRGRIRVQVDGGLKTGRDVVIGALLGADEFGFSTAPLVAMGCILMRVCHLNTCPVGIATQRPELRERFAGSPEAVTTFFEFVAQEVRGLMAELGYRTFDEMIGQADRLEFNDSLDHWKAKGLDYSDLLYRPDVSHDIRHTGTQDHELQHALDNRLLELAAPALERGEAVEINLPVKNTNRAVGTILGSEVSRKYGLEGLPDDTIKINLEGSAGQSLGAWLPRGISITVDGDANDYVGKGLSGGRVVVKVPQAATFDPSTNVIAGNVILYGATGGEVYIQGLAGERFGVRNSGGNAVVEGVGDHGCEYMTGGRFVILGPTGRNFAAGMSGGIAYVLDMDGSFPDRVNPMMVDLDPLTEDDLETIQRMLRKHFQYTRSKRADDVLRKWDTYAPKFVKVYPRDYKQALEERLQLEIGNG